MTKSTLLTTGHYDADLHHLRQRAGKAGYRLSDDGLCEGCGCALTECDVDAGECTQCRTVLETIDDE